MNRTLVAAVSVVAALILAAPSFATNNHQNAGPAPGSANTALKVVTGEVLVSTPDYLILATPSGMQRFEITPKSKIIGGTGEGDELTMKYRVVQVPARPTVAANAATTGTRAQVESVSVAAGRSAQVPAD